MNRDRVLGGWKQIKGEVHGKWAKLVRDAVSQDTARRNVLAGRLQRAYGIGRDEAQRQTEDWRNPVRDSANHPEAAPRQVNARR